MNHRVFQWKGTKSGDRVEAKVKELKKKKPKITMMESSIAHHNWRYMDSLTVCLRSTRSLMVAFSELSVHT